MSCGPTATVRRLLWLHASTRQGIQVSTSDLSHEAARLDIWLPRSRIEIVEEFEVWHRDGADRPRGTVLSFGTLLAIEGPAWLFRRKGLEADAELADHMVKEKRHG